MSALSLLLLTGALAGRPDPLAPAPHAGCPAVDSSVDVVEHALRVEWRLNEGQEPWPLGTAEIALATPTGGLHVAPEGDVGLRGKEASEVLRGDERVRETARVQSALKGRDRDGLEMSLRTTPEVDLILVTVRFEQGDATTLTVELGTPTRAVQVGDQVEVLVQLTPADVAVQPEG